jgi:glycerol-3-phosphate dehydrogenase (NAD(P)+)
MKHSTPPFTLSSTAVSRIADIAALAAPSLAHVQAILLTSKGFAPDRAGLIHLLPQTVTRAIAEATGRPDRASGIVQEVRGVSLENPPVIAIGGPCKANEVAARQPTAAIFGAPGGAEPWARWATTPAYRVAATRDRDGLELCAALKNVYAIALGVADGLSESGPVPFHDLKAAVFAQALAELRLLVSAAGADPWTALGLAGAGDLEVTGLSGRNKVFGARIGRGESASAALRAMAAADQTVEGAPAARLAMSFVAQRHPELAHELPLLSAIYDVVHVGARIDRIVAAAMP